MFYCMFYFTCDRSFKHDTISMGLLQLYASCMLIANVQQMGRTAVYCMSFQPIRRHMISCEKQDDKKP